MNDPTGTYGFAYDNMGRLLGTTTQYSFLSGTFTNAYTYDAASNRTGFTAPDGSTNTYNYDTLNRLSTLANSWAGSFGFNYDALSRRTQMTRPNNVTTNYSYDNLSRLLSVLHQLSGSTIDGAVYTVDPGGNRTSKADQLAGVTSNYGYDAIYELLSTTQGASTTESYTYDPVGNRLSSLSMSPYTNNSSNELTSTSNASYVYDNNGNMTSKTDSTGTTQYTWDFENRLMSVTLPNSGGTVSFKYDPFGRRIYKSSSSATSIYAYDGDNSIEEVNASGAAVARYTQGPGMDQPLAMSRSSATSYYEADGLGSVTSLSNGAGSLAETYTFDSFGKQTASSGSITNPFQYTAREFDTETGLYYYRDRYYDPTTGRFLSEDPIQFRGGINFYAYVGNNTPNRTDPDGTGFKDCATALEDLATAMWDVEKRLRELRADVDPGHVRRLNQAVDTLDWAIGQVEKYCKCNPKIVAILAAAGALVAKAVEALAQFCVKVPVCEFAQINQSQPTEDEMLALLGNANADGEPVDGNTPGRPITGMNWKATDNIASPIPSEASVATEVGNPLEKVPRYPAAAG